MGSFASLRAMGPYMAITPPVHRVMIRTIKPQIETQLEIQIQLEPRIKIEAIIVGMTTDETENQATNINTRNLQSVNKLYHQ